MPSIEEWLNGLGLGKYSKVFAENDVDLDLAVTERDAEFLQVGVVQVRQGASFSSSVLVRPQGVVYRVRPPSGMTAFCARSG